MPATKNGIYHNLKESKYAVSNGEMAFFFSSEMYMQKFLHRYVLERAKFAKRVKRPFYKCKLNFDSFSDLTLYAEIETRGFRVLIRGRETEWRNVEVYLSGKLIETSSNAWRQIHVQNLDV